MAEATYHYESGAIHEDHHREFSLTLNGDITTEAICKLAESVFGEPQKDAIDVEEVKDAPAASQIFDTMLDAELIEGDLSSLLKSKSYITVATHWYVVLQVFKEKMWTTASQEEFVKWVQAKFPDMKSPQDANSLRACRRTDLKGIDTTDKYPNGPYRDLAQALKSTFFGELKTDDIYEQEKKYLKYHVSPRKKSRK